MAQGAVICVAQGGHFAIEAPHVKTGCVAAQSNSRPAPLGPALESPAPRTCQDTPMFAAGSNMTMPANAEIVSSASQPVAILSLPTVVTHRARSLLSHVTSTALRSTHDSLRSVVLRR